MQEDEKLPFTSHLEELRKRLIVCFIAVGVGFVLAYGFKEKLFDVLTMPLIAVMEQGDKLIFTGLPEAFFTYLKVSFLSGLFLAVPVILFEFWMFMAPGLYKREKHLLFPIIILCSFFFIGGALPGVLLVIVVTVIYTHRLIGPAIPLLRHVKALQAGVYTHRVSLRRHDAFTELADELNELADSLQKSKHQQ